MAWLISIEEPFEGPTLTVCETEEQLVELVNQVYISERRCQRVVSADDEEVIIKCQDRPADYPPESINFIVEVDPNEVDEGPSGMDTGLVTAEVIEACDNAPPFREWHAENKGKWQERIEADRKKISSDD